MEDDQFQLGSGGWWDTTTRTTPPPASISMTLNTIASFGSAAAAAAAGGGGHDQSSTNQNLQMMGLGLSSQNLDWNQALFRGEKVESSFRSLLQEDYHHHHHQQQNQINRPSFSLDQTTPFSSQAAASSNDSTITSAAGGGGGGFQVDFHGMLLPDSQPTYQNRSPMSYQYPPGGGVSADFTTQFLRTSQTPDAAGGGGGGHLHFSNNTPFWNASAPPPGDGRSSFFPAGLQIHPPPPLPSFDDMTSKQEIGMRELNAITTKKNSSSSTETSNKRPRGNEAAPIPAFKVKKEKMGDRITALQQLVSPFGKTDTASVLSEAIEYIKFLHEQVNVLSTPYMKNGVTIQQHHHHHQINGEHKPKEQQEGPRQDLRSRGLCLVPVSSTFPMTHETTVDFWTPTFGDTFR